MSWIEVAQAPLPGGDTLTLRQRGGDFEIRFNLVELMSSRNPLSERALAAAACARISTPSPHILIGGLGMGYTVRAVLDAVGMGARLTVAELVPEVIAWNRGPLGALASHPLDDPRVSVENADVGDILHRRPGAFDIILMDVDNGPEAVLFPGNVLLYAADGVALIRSALKPGGVFALWAADASSAFEHVLEGAGVAYQRLIVPVPAARPVEHTLYLVT